MRQATTGLSSSEREDKGMRNEDWKETDILKDRKEKKKRRKERKKRRKGRLI